MLAYPHLINFPVMSPLNPPGSYEMQIRSIAYHNWEKMPSCLSILYPPRFFLSSSSWLSLYWRPLLAKHKGLPFLVLWSFMVSSCSAPSIVYRWNIPKIFFTSSFLTFSFPICQLFQIHNQFTTNPMVRINPKRSFRPIDQYHGKSFTNS